MNEIPKAALTQPTQIKSVSASAVVASAKQSVGGNDLPLPEKAAKPKVADAKKMQESVEAAVAQMNQFIQSTQRDLHFSYDKASGETVVKVLNRTTQEVIRQIPDETFLKLAQTNDSTGDFHFFSAQA